MSRILGIGNAATDVILGVQGYPKEDSENRALWQRITRGGNCCNTLVVLSQLGHRCYWGGACRQSPDTMAQVILDDLQRYGICLDYCQWQQQGSTPTSYIYLNVEKASRTIVHIRDLEEYSAESFAAIPLQHWDWIHFEARNTLQLANMMERIQDKGIPCSLEVEKPRDHLTSLLPLADIIFFSKDYAESKGYKQPAEFLKRMAADYAVNMTCTWGAGGVWLREDKEIVHIPAPTITAVDTIGAGDTFNAGVIHGLLQKLPLKQAVEQACRLATQKCQFSGLDLATILSP